MSFQNDYLSRDDELSEPEMDEEEKKTKFRDEKDFKQHNHQDQQQNNFDEQQSCRNNRSKSTKQNQSRGDQQRPEKQKKQKKQNNKQKTNSYQRQEQRPQYMEKDLLGQRQYRVKYSREDSPIWQEDLELPCNKILDCGHKCQSLIKYDPCPPCEQDIFKILECLHKIEIKCKNRNDEILCNKLVQYTLDCYHKISYTCDGKKKIIVCNKPCERLLPCEHKCNLLCGEDCSKQICKEETTKQLECLHEVIVKCHEYDQALECFEQCREILQCGHYCKALCKDQCPKNFHDICELRTQGDCYYYIPDDSSDVSFEQFFNLVKKYNNFYQSKTDINFKIEKEVEIEIYIFKQLFLEEIEKMHVENKFLSYKRKLIRYLSQYQLHELIDRYQLKFLKDLTHQFIIQHYKHIQYQIESINEINCTEIQQYKIFNYYLGKMICNQKLVCGHICKEFFHLSECICQVKEIIIIRKCGHQFITECHNREFKFLNPCRDICNRELPCKHLCQKLCGQECICEKVIQVNQENCNHRRLVVCGRQQLLKPCIQMKTITFQYCKHQKQVYCHDQTTYQCEESIQITCQKCKHSTQIKCKEKNTFKCMMKVKKTFQNCDHSKEVLCQDMDKQDINCYELTQHVCRRCQDTKQIQCMEKMNYECHKQRTMQYKYCSHYQTFNCYQFDLFINCSIKVTLCQHQQNIECFKTTKNCEKQCGKLLACNHACKMACNMQCICTERIRYKLKCGHIKLIYCYERQTTIVCDQVCQRILNCKHPCKQNCIEQCKCEEKVDHQFNCGHKVSVQCGQQTNYLVCQLYKEITLTCNHKQVQYCKDKQIYQCREICKKVQSCGDKCFKYCYEQCQCQFETRKVYPCQHSVIGCWKSIPLLCQQIIQEDYQCGHQEQRICSEEKAYCKKRCQRILKCKHPCQDLCRNKCQDKCNQCLEDEKQAYSNQLKLFILKFDIINTTNDKTSNSIQQNYPICNKILKCNHKCRMQKDEQCQCNEITKYQCKTCKNKVVLLCDKTLTHECNGRSVQQCQQCKIEQIVLCGGQLKCKCQAKQNLFSNLKRCKVILSCNHPCQGTLCTSNFHELCKYASSCRHNIPVYCSGYSSCKLCDPLQQSHENILKNCSLYTINSLPYMKNVIYERNRILIQQIIKDESFKYIIDYDYCISLNLKVENLVFYIKEDKKSFFHLSKYSKMEKIEKSDFYLSSQQLKYL